MQGIFKIASEEGLRKGIYKGLLASCARESVYSSLRLGLYEPIKRTLSPNEGVKQPVWIKFAAGALSGLIGSAIANPADLLKTRMQAMPPGENLTLSWHVKDVYRNHGGIPGFWNGV